MSDTPSYEALLLPLEVVRNHVEAAKDELRRLQTGAEARFGPVMAAGVRLQVQAAIAALSLTYAPPPGQASGEWGVVPQVEEALWHAEVESDEMALLVQMERAVGER
jgi:hypothetical protein